MADEFPGQLRKTVWRAMLDTDLNYRYYGKLGRRYSGYERATKIFSAVASSSVVASWGMWSDVPILWKILSGISAMVAVVLPVVNWPKFIEASIELRTGWFQIMREYENLWLTIETHLEDPNEIQKRYEQISSMEVGLVRTSANLPEDKRLIINCQQEVLTSRQLLEEGTQ